MNIRKALSFAVVALVLGLTGTSAWADGADKGKAPAKEAAKQHSDSLTDESLKEKLENLGYEVKVTRSKSGGTMYLLNFERDNYRYVFYCSLSSDRSRLWLSSALRQLPDAKDVRADVLEKILARNNEIGPTHFALRSNRFLYLELSLENRGITSLRLRKEIDGFAADVRSSEHLWNPAKWPKVEAPKVEAPKTEMK